MNLQQAIQDYKEAHINLDKVVREATADDLFIHLINNTDEITFALNRYLDARTMVDNFNCDIPEYENDKFNEYMVIKANGTPFEIDKAKDEYIKYLEDGHYYTVLDEFIYIMKFPNEDELEKAFADLSNDDLVDLLAKLIAVNELTERALSMLSITSREDMMYDQISSFCDLCLNYSESLINKIGGQ